MYPYQPAFDLDLTGKNPKNLVKNEPHKLSKGKVNRAIIPNHGLYYSGSLIVMDGSRELVNNVDYINIELHQDLTTKSGLAVHTVIVITDKSVSDNVSITYQAVGGYYDRNNEAIENLYNSVVNDTRLVSWDNISSKPSEYPPAEHYHPLNDIVNWTPIIHQLERIGMILSCNKLDLNKKFINAVAADFKCHQLEYNLPSSNLMKYDAFLHALSERKLLSNLSVNTQLCGWTPGRMAHFDIDTSQFPKGSEVYWRFYKEDGETINLAIPLEGRVVGNGGKVRKYIYIPGRHQDEEEALYIGVNSKPFEKDFEGVSYKIQFLMPMYANGTYPVVKWSNDFDNDDSSKVTYHDDNEFRRVSQILTSSSSFDVRYL